MFMLAKPSWMRIMSLIELVFWGRRHSCGAFFVMSRRLRHFADGCFREFIALRTPGEETGGDGEGHRAEARAKGGLRSARWASSGVNGRPPSRKMSWPEAGRGGVAVSKRR